MRTTVDARGTTCPAPVLGAARAAAGLEVGDELEVLWTDPAAAADVPAWARMRGHAVLERADGRTVVRIAG